MSLLFIQNGMEEFTWILTNAQSFHIDQQHERLRIQYAGRGFYICQGDASENLKFITNAIIHGKKGILIFKDDKLCIQKPPIFSQIY